MNSEELTNYLSNINKSDSTFNPDNFLNVNENHDKIPVNNNENQIQLQPSISSPSVEASSPEPLATNLYTISTDDPEFDFDSELFDKLNTIDPVNAGFLYQYFAKFNVKHSHIQYLKDFHIQTIIPISEIGVMAEFQHKLEYWKRSEKGLEVNTVQHENPISKSSLLDIIADNPKLVAKAHKSNLTDKESKLLLTMVRDHFMYKCGNRMTVSDQKKIAQEIEDCFPGEAVETYFKTTLIKQKDGTFKSKSTGQLVSKWTNRSEKQSVKTKKLLDDTANQTLHISVTHIENEEEQKRIQSALKNSSKKPLEMILKDWAACRDIRLRFLIEKKDEGSIFEILEEWPTYTWPDGNILVS